MTDRHWHQATYGGTLVRSNGFGRDDRRARPTTCWRCGAGLPAEVRPTHSGLCRDCQPHKKDYERNPL